MVDRRHRIPLHEHHDPTGEIHGIPSYSWRRAPEGLATKRQLRAEGLRPNGQEPVAQIVHKRGKTVGYLYRRDLAAPKRTATPAQLEATRKALRARMKCGYCDRPLPYIPAERYGRRGECCQT